MKEKHQTIITLVLLAATLIAVSILMAGALSANNTGVDSPYADAYFDPDTVNTVSITISEENWQDLLDNPTAEEYHLCNIEINETQPNPQFNEEQLLGVPEGEQPPQGDGQQQDGNQTSTSSPLSLLGIIAGFSVVGISVLRTQK